MAETKLWLGNSMMRMVMLGMLVFLLSSCRADDKPIGMTLLFQSAGRPVGVKRFDPDGIRGPVPGAVGGIYPRGGKEMSFMPGDSKRGLPKFVDVSWMVATPEYDKQWETLSRRNDKYSKQWIADVEETNANAPNHTRRIDLSSIITPELVAQVRANAQSTQLKLTITFNNDDVDITAMADKWR